MDSETRELLNQVKTQLGENSKIKAAVQQLEEQMKGLPQTVENKLRAVRSIAWDQHGRYRGVFDTEDDARCFGLHVMAHVGRDSNAEAELTGNMKSVYERAMGGTDTALGGATIPVEFARRIQRLVEDFSVYAADAFSMPMSTDSLTFQRRTSGLKVFKTGHNVASTASEMGFDTVNLNADEWNALALYPKALDADAAGAVGELVAMEIAQAFAEAIDSCGFVGDATPAYLDVHGLTFRLKSINGVDDGGGLVLASGAPASGWGGFSEPDFSKAIGQLPNYRGIAPRWYCSNAFFWTVMNPITLAKGGVTAAEFRGEQKLMFLGHEVRITNAMPKVTGNSQIPCLFGDLKLSSTHGQRQQLTIEQSTDVKFIERQVAVLGTQRHAIANHTLGDATNAGPMVGLITQPAA